MATRKVDQTPKKRPPKGPKKAELWGVKDIRAEIDYDSWSKLRDFGIEGGNKSIAGLIVEGLNLLLVTKGAEFRVERMTPERLAAKGSVPVSVQAQGKLPLGVATNPVKVPSPRQAGE